MQKEIFTGRSQELAQLSTYLKKKTSSLIVIKGRRRIGKSRLVDEFAQRYKFYKFSGLPPVEAIKAQDQRNEFAQQLSQQTGLPEIQTDDWSKLFSLLARETAVGRVIVFLDEITWMADGDPTFIGKLKNAWDDQFKKNNKLILILCSSVSTWIEENIINSTGFFGRISWVLSLDPLPLSDCNTMLEQQGFKSSNYEKFKILSITGGIPWYLEQIQGEYSADENIKRQCFTKGGVLVEDFSKIFHDLFAKRDTIYKKVICGLATGPMTYEQIASNSQYSKSGRLSEYLDHLIQAGFVSRDYTWSLKTGKLMQLSQYRISDNYIRFYLKYIEPKKKQIEEKRIEKLNLTTLPGWETMMGLQFENLVVNNRHLLYQILNLEPESIVFDNPFFQHPTTRQKGCQIDFLIQTRFNTIYVVEIKFSKNPVKRKVIDEVKEKIKRISLPRGIAVLPILVHVNGVIDSIEEDAYFYRIIDFGELLGLGNK
ncbi:MAG: ATPase [Gammaproteobacteria bacterium RIFCSPHIGHO2_12_FULL_41_15]|nr:MAG: ATPase [Gammaproteobacteria bacterium RIFCSPHIGHO2_12_FULL_41_15]